MSNHSARSGGCFQRQRADEKGHLCSARGFYRLCKHTQLQKFSGRLLPFKKTDDEKILRFKGQLKGCNNN